MNKIKVKLNNCEQFINKSDYDGIFIEIENALLLLENKQGKGNDYLGWVELPNTISQVLLDDLNKTARKIRNESNILVVIGIGGSYLGSKAVIDALKGYFTNKGIEVLFMGNSISSTYISEIVDYLKDKEFSVNVISKSGTTTEPAIAFRVINELLIKKYGKKANERIYVTTDEKKGALRKLANEFHYKSFVIPSDVGGRFSVLTPVGLLPIAVAGFDINKLLNGAKQAYENSHENVKNYIAARNILYRKGKKIEIMVNYEPKLHYLIEWWKQLFGESEGKDGKGIFPAGVDFSADLHSMGQYMQDGERILFETVLNIKQPIKDYSIPKTNDDKDGLRYIEGESINYVNSQAMKGTIAAHVEGKVPNIEITIPILNEETIGYLLYFFEKSCGVSGYVLGVNPFNQPGVEKYKTNMFTLLGKPGY